MAEYGAHCSHKFHIPMDFFFVLSILQPLIAFNSILKASFGTSSLPSLHLGYSDGRPLKQTGRVGW